MPGIDLGGFDIVFQLSEDEINTQLDATPQLANGVSAQFTTSGKYFFDRIELLAPNSVPGMTNPVNIYVRAVNISVNNGPVQPTEEITITTQIQAQHNLTNNTANIVVPTHPTWSNPPPIINIGNLTPGNIVRQSVEGLLGSLFSIPLNTEPINLIPGAGPLEMQDIEVRNTLDPNTPSERCLSMLVSMGGATAPSAASFPQSNHLNGNNSAVVVSNDYLLGRVIRPLLVAEFDVPFNAPCTMNGQYRIYDGIIDIFLETLSISAGPGFLRGFGTIGGNGWGWSVDGFLDMQLHPNVQDGDLNFTSQVVNQSGQVRVEWWLYALSFLTFGWALTLVLGVADRIGDIVTNILINQFAHSVPGLISGSSFVNLPTGPIGDGFVMDSVIIDDLIGYGHVTTRPVSGGTGSPNAQINGSWNFHSAGSLSSTINNSTMEICTVIGSNYVGWYNLSHNGFAYPADIKWFYRNPGNTPSWVELPRAALNGAWQTQQVQTGRLIYKINGNSIHLKNDPTLKCLCLLRAEISDAQGHLRRFHKLITSPGPVVHKCNFTNAIINGTGDTISVPVAAKAALPQGAVNSVKNTIDTKYIDQKIAMKKIQKFLSKAIIEE